MHVRVCQGKKTLVGLDSGLWSDDIFHTLVARRGDGERDRPALLDALLVRDADHLGPRTPEPQPPDLVVGVLLLLGEGHSRQEQDRLKTKRGE